MDKVTKNRRFVVLVISLAILIIIPLCIPYFFGYRLNVTDSYPRGVWKIYPGEYKKGAFISFCPPLNNIAFTQAKERGYFRYGSCPGNYPPLIKKIVGLPGDRVAINNHDIITINSIEQKNGKRLLTDSKGSALPVPELGVIPNNNFWLMSDYNGKSFDSRYFGYIASNQIIGTIKPIYTIDSWE